MKTLISLVCAFVFLLAALKSSAQEAGPPNVIISPEQDYRIGPGDVIEIHVIKAPELSRTYQVVADGTIQVPFVGNVTAYKRTAQELSRILADGLRGDYLVDPQVWVTVKQTSNRFFIQGAVRQAGVYQMDGRPTLLELIAVAGGLTDSYGATAFIIRRVESERSGSDAVEQQANGGSDAEGQRKYELTKANINALFRGDFSQNLEIIPGDIVNIPLTDVFFVAGEVNKPGSFALKEGTTLRQAISLAQGTNFKAAPAQGIIFRENPNGKREELRVDINAVMRGRTQDLPLIANDIIIVPNSKAKSTFVPLLSAFGFSAVQGAIYRIP